MGLSNSPLSPDVLRKQFERQQKNQRMLNLFFVKACELSEELNKAIKKLIKIKNRKRKNRKS